MKIKCPKCKRTMKAKLDKEGIIWGVEEPCCKHFEGILFTDIVKGELGGSPIAP